MKGILFKPWKIKAIAEDDGEWQTRRVIKPQPCDDKTFIYADGYCSLQAKNGYAPYAKSRYQVGEVVYIKEAFMIEQSEGFDEPTDRPFKNDYEWGLLIPHYKLTDPDPELYDDEDRQVKWRSPLFMPEWAARYFLKITDIRAERLQEITNEDITAEGLGEGYTKFGWTYAFGQLWNSINPKYPWAMNPWVFVYSFKKAEK